MCHAQEAARIIFMVHDEVKDKMFELGRLYTTYLRLLLRKKYKIAKFRKLAGKLFFSIEFISNQQLSANCDFCRSIWFRTFSFVSRSLRLCFTDWAQFFSHGEKKFFPSLFFAIVLFK
jgi:hypothetical protein